MAKKQELSKTDKNFASKDADAIRNAWAKWDLPAYSCPAKDRYGNTIYSDVQKAVILQLKPIFENWEQYILANAKTDESKTTKLKLFRKYVKDILNLPDDKFYYRHIPFSLLNFKENIRGRANEAYRDKKREIGQGVQTKNGIIAGKIPVKKASLKRGIDNAVSILDMLDSIETSEDFILCCLSIQILTGRRKSEIMSSETNFTNGNEPGYLNFQGISKGGDEKFRKSYSIPVLGNCESAILAAHSKVKKWLENNHFIVESHARPIEKAFGLLFPEIVSDCFAVGHLLKGKTNFLRKLYVAYCLEYLRPEYIDEAMYMAQILVEGVEKPDGKMIFSITTASYYRGIVLED